MIFTPDFYNKFKCIADKCKDSCCVGWEIDVDAETLEKFKCFSDEALPHVELDAEPPYIKLDGEGRCPFLDESGLCKIISKHGEDFIPEICKRHPRYFNEILNFTECSIGLSCPTAAEIILSVREKPKTVKLNAFSTREVKTAKIEGEIPTDEENTVKTLLDLRDEIFSLVFDRRYDMPYILTKLLGYQRAISDYLFDGSMPCEIAPLDAEELYSVIDLVPLAFSRLELLSEDVRSLAVGAVRERLLSILLANADESRALLYYFLHRYMLSGACEFDLDDRVTLCVLLLFICLAFVDSGVSAESAALFSKNVEYSTENIDILLRIIAERY